MAIISEQLRINKRTGNAQLLRKYVNVIFESLLLATAFILAGTSIAKSTAASTNNLTSSIRFLNCDGDKPGFCPNGPFANMRTGGNLIFSTIIS